MRLLRLLLVALLTAAVMVGAGGAASWWLWQQGVELAVDQDGVSIVQVLDLQALPWMAADTGWFGIAMAADPTPDRNFAGGPITVQGAEQRGIGVYPTSEIRYDLNGDYRTLRLGVALDDNTPPSTGQTRFLVFGDDQLLFDSGGLTAAAAPKRTQVSVEGVDELRLVAVDESRDQPGFAVWLDPQLRQAVNLRNLLNPRPQAAQPKQAPDTIDAERARVRGTPRTEAPAPEERPARQGPRRPRRAAATARTGDAFPPAVAAGLVGLEPGDLGSLPGVWLPDDADGHPAAQALFDPLRRRCLLLNPHLAVVIGCQGEALGALTVLDRDRGVVVLRDAAPRMTLADGAAFDPATLTPVESPAEALEVVDDPGFGLGVAATVRMLAARSGMLVRLRVALYQDGQFLVTQISVEGGPEGGPAVARYDLVDPQRARLTLQAPASYVTAYGRPTLGRIRPDSVPHRMPVQEGAPVLLWSGDPAENVVLALLDEAGGPAEFTAEWPAQEAAVRLGFSVAPLPGNGGALSPRFYLGFNGAPNAAAALAGYRQAFGALYPAAPIPPWFKYEWNSWYTYYMDVSEDELHAQMDYLSATFSDLGPWQVALDAGWYVAEGREGSGWRTPDTAKFPSGIGALAEHAHERDLRTVLYFSAPYVDTRARTGNWLGLSGLAAAHPEYLTPVDEDATGRGYVYAIRRPEFQSYLHEVLDDYFTVYGVDGIEVDGLGTVPGPPGRRIGRDRYGIAPVATGSTMDWFRSIWQAVQQQRPDAYVYAGWHAPLFARQYAHAFWYSDEYPSFDNPYPYGGVQQHVDYAILQEGLWGQRAHMGYAYGDPNHEPAPRLWLEAAVALGTQISLGFDLRGMLPETISAYRARLNHYHPHQAPIFTVGAYPPDVFGSRWNGATYVGVMNRGDEAREITFNLEEVGLDPRGSYLVYDADQGVYTMAAGALAAPMAGHSFRLLLVRSEPGVVWTDSSYQQTATPRGLQLALDGPEGLSGFAEVYVPEAPEVTVNGTPIALGEEGGEVTARYDEQTGVLRLDYPMARYRVDVRW